MMSGHAMDPPFFATGPAMESWLASEYPKQVRVADATGAHSYAEIHDRSSKLARGLIASGVAKGTRIGILLPNGADFVETLSGVNRMGGHAVLVSTLARPRELAFMIRHADIDLLIMTDHYLGRDYVAEMEEALPSLAASAGSHQLRLREAPFLRSIWMKSQRLPDWARDRNEMTAAGETIDEAFLASIESEVVPADSAILIYSSGSTAEPKAVVHSHGNLARQGWRMSRYATYDPGDRLMTTMPFFWVGGLCTSMLAANLRGAAIVVPDHPSIGGMREAMEQHGVTHVALWPTQLTELIESPGFGDVRDRLKPTSAQQLSMFGLASPEHTPNALGMTETLGPHSMELFENPLPNDHAGSFGRAVGGIERQIIDPETGVSLPPGQEGELIVRGGASLTGFHRKERHEVFDADGFYHSGDLARLAEDGHLYFKGRSGDLIKTAGVNVSPREIEEALMAEPEVAEAVALGLPDAVRGEILVAAIVLRPGLFASEDDLANRLRARLSSYKVPRRIVVMGPEDMPRTASAKIQKPALRILLAQRIQS